WSPGRSGTTAACWLRRDRRGWRCGALAFAGKSTLYDASAAFPQKSCNTPPTFGLILPGNGGGASYSHNLASIVTAPFLERRVSDEAATHVGVTRLPLGLQRDRCEGRPRTRLERDRGADADQPRTEPVRPGSVHGHHSAGRVRSRQRNYR